MRASDGVLVVDVAGKLARTATIKPSDIFVCAPTHEAVMALASTHAHPDPHDFASQVARQLRRHALSALGLAHKAGGMAIGYSKAEATLQNGKAVLLFNAHDGASGGRTKLAGKIDNAAHLIDIFSTMELSMALGRHNVHHACLVHGRLRPSLLRTCHRLMHYENSDMCANLRPAPIVELIPEPETTPSKRVQHG